MLLLLVSWYCLGTIRSLIRFFLTTLSYTHTHTYTHGHRLGTRTRSNRSIQEPWWSSSPPPPTPLLMMMMMTMMGDGSVHSTQLSGISIFSFGRTSFGSSSNVIVSLCPDSNRVRPTGRYRSDEVYTAWCQKTVSQSTHTHTYTEYRAPIHAIDQ